MARRRVPAPVPAGGRPSPGISSASRASRWSSSPSSISFSCTSRRDVSQTSYQFIATRYANPFWRVYDLLLLTLALFHGLNGLRIACDDYIHSRGMRLAVVSVLFLTAISFWLLGSMTIITFHAAATSTGSVSPLLTALAYL